MADKPVKATKKPGTSTRDERDDVRPVTRTTRGLTSINHIVSLATR